jgi:sugar phosphate isomerase/epimerase
MELMTRRQTLALLTATLARAADRLPKNQNVKWALGSNLWNYFPRVPFTDILDVMKDTGFIGIRLTQFPQILKTYDITAAQMQKEASKRGCQIITISFNGPTHDPARRSEVIASAKTAMNFLKEFDANHLVVFPPNRSNLTGEASFKAMCDGFNDIGSAAREMGFYAGLHNHMAEMVQNPGEIDRCMAMTDPKLFWFSPDTAHLHLAGCDVAATLDKHKHRLIDG